MSLATFKLHVMYGTSAAKHRYISDSHIAFLNIDSASVDTNTYPVAVPANDASSPNYSYEKWMYFTLNTYPNNYISNLRVYGPATEPGNTLRVMMTTARSTVVCRPTPRNTISTIDAEHVKYVAHTNYYDQQHALRLPIPSDATNARMTGALSTAGYLVMQLLVGATAPSGSPGSVNFNLVYEET